MSDNEKARAGNTGHEQGNDLSSSHSVEKQSKIVNNPSTIPPATPEKKLSSKVVPLPRKMTDDDFKQIYNEVIKTAKRRVSMPRWVSYLGFSVNGTSKNYICPFHSERTGSFHVYEDGSYCYGKCDRSFDHIDFAMQYKGWDKKQAVETLAEFAGVDIPWKRGKKTKKPVNNSQSAAVQRPITAVEPKSYTDNREYTDEETHNYLANSGKTFIREHYYPKANPISKRVIYEHHVDGVRKKTGLHWTKTESGKWQIGRRVTPTLYLQEYLTSKPDIKTVVYVGGEKDGDKATEMGYLSVTAGSDNDFKPYASLFVPLFRGRDVVLFPDNDDTGRKAFIEIAWLLRGIANSVKIVNLPLNKGKEDFYDFVMGESYCNGNLEIAKTKIEELIAEAPVFEPDESEDTNSNNDVQDESEEPAENRLTPEDIQKIFGLPYLPQLPPQTSSGGFDVKLDRQRNVPILHHTAIRNTAVKITNMGDLIVPHSYIKPLRQLREQMLIKSPYRRCTVRRNLTNKQTLEEIVEIAGQLIDDKKLKLLTQFLSDYSIINTGNIPTLMGFDQTGWYKKTDGTEDYAIPTVPNNDGEWINDDLLSSFCTKGSKEQHYAKLREIMQTKGGLPVLAVLAANINQKLFVPNFTVLIYGRSGGQERSGKSAANAFAFSTIGDTNEQKLIWWATRTGFENRLAAYKNVAIRIEELKTNDSDMSELIQFIYTYSEQKGKLRGKDSETAQRIKNLYGAIVATSEEDLLTLIESSPKIRSKPTGSFKRTLQIKAGTDFFTKMDGTKMDPQSLHVFSQQHCGWIGADWIVYMKNNLDKIAYDYELCKKVLQAIIREERAEPVGLEMMYASMLTVLNALYEMGALPREIADHMAGILIAEVRREARNVEEQRDITVEFLRKLGSWSVANNSKFQPREKNNPNAKYEGEDRRDWYGAEYDNDDLFITTEALLKFNESAKLPTKEIKEELDNCGILKVNDKTNNTHLAKASVAGKKPWGLYIKRFKTIHDMLGTGKTLAEITWEVFGRNDG